MNIRELHQVLNNDTRKYNFWVNFILLPKLVEDYKDGIIQFENFMDKSYFTNGSERYNDLCKRIIIQKNATKDTQYISIETPSNKSIGEVCIAAIAFNQKMRDAIILTMEYTFDSKFVVCIPDANGNHLNTGVFVEDSQEFFHFFLSYTQGHNNSVEDTDYEVYHSTYQSNSIKLNPRVENKHESAEKNESIVINNQTKRTSKKEHEKTTEINKSHNSRKTSFENDLDKINLDWLLLINALQIINANKSKTTINDTIYNHYYNIICDSLLKLYSGDDWFNIFIENTTGMEFFHKIKSDIPSWDIVDFEHLWGEMQTSASSDKGLVFVCVNNDKCTNVYIGPSARKIITNSVADFYDNKNSGRFRIYEMSPNRYSLELITKPDNDGEVYLLYYIKERLSFYCDLLQCFAKMPENERTLGIHNLYYLMKKGKYDLYPSLLYNPPFFHEMTADLFCKYRDLNLNTSDCPIEFEIAINNIIEVYCYSVSNNSKIDLEVINADKVQQSWPLMDFAKAHGRMSVASMTVTKGPKAGEKYKICRFAGKPAEDNKPAIRMVFCTFSEKLGELTPTEISEQKHDLEVVLLTSGKYELRRQENRIRT